MQEGYPAEGERRAEVAVGIFVWEFMDGNFRVEAIRVAFYGSEFLGGEFSFEYLRVGTVRERIFDGCEFSAGNFRLGIFVWVFTGGNLRLGTCYLFFASLFHLLILFLFTPN